MRTNRVSPHPVIPKLLYFFFPHHRNDSQAKSTLDLPKKAARRPRPFAEAVESAASSEEDAHHSYLRLVSSGTGLDRTRSRSRSRTGPSSQCGGNLRKNLNDSRTLVVLNRSQTFPIIAPVTETTGRHPQRSLWPLLTSLSSILHRPPHR
jgi:hypothetical protein